MVSTYGKEQGAEAMGEEEWERTEEKFARLVRLGGDERTPEHERNAACRAAVRMFRRGDMTVTSTGRWEALSRLVNRLLRTVADLREALPPEADTCRAPFNLNGKNGWQCCQCSSFNTSLVVHWRGFGFGGHRCTTCGHPRCDRPKPDAAWDPPTNPSARTYWR